MITTEASSKVTHNEIIKEATPTLAGAIARTLADPEADRFSEDDVQFLKFHGIYQQDDRDLRKTQKKFIMMIRGRIPGGVMTPRQWCVFDELATQHGNNTLRDTTRQSIQFHGVVKSGDRKSTRLNSSHSQISYAVFCLEKKNFLATRAVRAWCPSCVVVRLIGRGALVAGQRRANARRCHTGVRPLVRLLRTTDTPARSL